MYRFRFCLYLTGGFCPFCKLLLRHVGFRPRRDQCLILVHFSSMPNTQCENYEGLILDMADQAIIADPVTPLTFSVRDKGFSVCPWIFTTHKIFIDPGINHLPGIFIQSFQLPYRPFRIFYPVTGHKPSISFTSSWEYVFGFSTYS